MNRTPCAWIVRCLSALAVALAVATPTGCATNPVTGRAELQFVSEAREMELGQANYAGYQQAQGGAYVAHPQVTDYVRQIGRRLWSVSDRSHLPYEITVLNHSVPNAWALPGGKMAINRGLLTELNSEAELAAVLGHEIVHVAARHGAKNVERGTLMQGLLLGTGLALNDRDYADIIVGAGGLAAGLLNLKYGRGAELEADRYGIAYLAQAGYDPRAAVSLQETFVKLSNSQNPGWLAGLFASHPPSQERVEANRATAAPYPAGGRVGREDYLAALAPLLAARPAYAAMDAGYAALLKGQHERALELAREAIRLEPREGHFHGLAAKAQAAAGRQREAIGAWDKAIGLNDAYFEYYLRRGELHYGLGDRANAGRNLKKSVALLPTASGHYLLGMLAVDARKTDEAAEHFRVAAGSDSDDGEKARIMLARIEMQAHPERYLQAGFTRDRNGYAILVLGNTTAVDVTDCRVGVYNAASGRWESYRFANGVPARRQAQVTTRIGPFADEATLQRQVRLRFDRVVVADAIGN